VEKIALKEEAEMKVKDIMTRDVVIADKDDTVLTVAKLMKHHNIGTVPVVENAEKVLGMVTDRDIVLNMADYNFDPANTKALTLMSNKVYSVKPEADINSAIALMKKQQIRRLPVIENEKLVGMLSIGDIAVRADYDVEISEAIAEISLPDKPKNI
jgi:CBS domain-containing protein